MKPRKATYIAHRWLGLVVSLQLLAWSTGGFIFSVLDIAEVRGERDATESEPEPIPADIVSFDGAINAAAELNVNRADITAARLLDRGLGPQWELLASSGATLARIDATTGAASTEITPEQAEQLALADFAPTASVCTTEHLTEDDFAIQPGGEFRGGPVGAYRVRLEHPKNPRIYIDAVTGRVIARRNDSWRLFDFFWMLHVMDYNTRDDFNHPLLTAFSALAIASAASGLLLWLWRVLPKRKATRRDHTPEPLAKTSESADPL